MNHFAIRSIVFVFLFLAFSSSVFAASADQRDRVLKMCETHFRLSKMYDCGCYADAFLKNEEGQPRKNDKIIMEAVDVRHCVKGDDAYQEYAHCVNQGVAVDGHVKDYCQCLYDERKARPVNPADFPNQKAVNMEKMRLKAQGNGVCQKKFFPKPVYYTGDALIKKRLSDGAFTSVFNFDFYVCGDYGVRQGQSEGKTRVRQFVNSFCGNVKAIRESNAVRDWDNIIGQLGVIQDRLDKEMAGYQKFMTTEENKIYLRRCNQSNTSCREECAKTPINVKGVCICGLTRLGCLSSASLDME